MIEHRPPHSELGHEFGALRGAKGVQALTDDGREEILVSVRDIAARLAAALNTTLFLADRSAQTWTHTPHVYGPARIAALRQRGVSHMVRQMEAAFELGVADVRGIAPSIPNSDFFTDGLHATGAQIVVAPSRLDHLRILTRLANRLQGSDDLINRVRKRLGDRHLVIVEVDGSYRLG